MEQLYTLTANKKILLTASSVGLYSHLFHNERFLRSSLLCSNYEHGLSGTLYNDTLYYTYINKERSLLLRCIGESSLQFRLDGTETIAYHAPRLTVFGGFLLLLYFECMDGLYHLRIQAPFATLPPIPLPSVLPAPFVELPDLRILLSETHLYLLLSAGDSSFLFRYTTAFAPEVLGTEKENELQALNVHLAEKEATLQATEALLVEKTSELSDTKSRLQQSEEHLHRTQNRLTECDAARREALQNLTHTASLLERAKVQYEELMQIALQYKEEAAKWYGKFTDRH